MEIEKLSSKKENYQNFHKILNSYNNKMNEFKMNNSKVKLLS